MCIVATEEPLKKKSARELENIKSTLFMYILFIIYITKGDQGELAHFK